MAIYKAIYDTWFRARPPTAERRDVAPSARGRAHNGRSRANSCRLLASRLPYATPYATGEVRDE